MRTARGRLVSLDAFRGLTIALMILVNNPAGETRRYAFLRHALWNGCRLADVIFPAFLFISGVSIALSFPGRRGRGTNTLPLVGNILRRSAIIFGLGLLLNALPYFDWEIVRVPGVLQRIALAYLGASLIALRWGPAGQGLWVAAILLVYGALMILVPVPGYGAGELQPETNLAAYVDRLILGTHMAHHNWDPEGILGALPSVASVLAGSLAGHWILSQPRERVTSGLVAGGVLAMVLGLWLDHWFPLNKNLWTSSYVLFTAGVSATALAACFWSVDVRGHKRWTTPFLVFGTNPILAYWLSSAVGKILELVHVTRASGRSIFLETHLVDWLRLLGGSRPLAALIYALLYTGLWLVLLWPLYRRDIFVRI